MGENWAKSQFSRALFILHKVPSWPLPWAHSFLGTAHSFLVCLFFLLVWPILDRSKQASSVVVGGIKYTHVMKSENVFPQSLVPALHHTYRWYNSSLNRMAWLQHCRSHTCSSWRSLPSCFLFASITLPCFIISISPQTSALSFSALSLFSPLWRCVTVDRTNLFNLW